MKYLRNVDLLTKETVELKSEHFHTLLKCLTLLPNILSPKNQIYSWKNHTIIIWTHKYQKKRFFKNTHVNH